MGGIDSYSHVQAGEDNGSASRVNDLRAFLDVINQRLEEKKWTILDDMGQSDNREKLTKVCRNILLVKMSSILQQPSVLLPL